MGKHANNGGVVISWKCQWIIVIWSLLLVSAGFCVPAPPGHWIELSQPDGTRFVAQVRGDEFCSWLEDQLGYPIVRVMPLEEYRYALIDSTGAFKASQFLAGEVDPRLTPLEPHVVAAEGIIKAKRERAFSRTPSVRTSLAKQPAGPTSGPLKSLVLLVNFSNTTPSYPPQALDDLYNATGYAVGGARGSVRDYFSEVSYNQLTVNSTVVGWINLPQTNAYYAGDDDMNGEGDGSFGLNELKYPFNAQRLVEDALDAADPLVDFSQFDQDGDGWIDAVSICHQGPGAEMTYNINYVWSHYGSISSPRTYDGVQVYHYQLGPELYDNGGGLVHIGVICHELSHFLGLPDLYDYDFDSYGIGMWGLMGYGNWNDLGRSPAHLCAWSKVQLGWLTPTIMNYSRPDLDLPGVEGTPLVYKIWEGMPPQQYFLVENRQFIGFDEALPGSGLLIWHIDDSQPDNNDENRMMVALEQADGLRDIEQQHNYGDANDPFPGGTFNHSFREDTVPSSNPYGADPSYIRLTDIHIDGENAAFDLQTLLPYLWSSDPVSYTGNYSLSWTASSTAAHYTLQEGTLSPRFRLEDGAEAGLGAWISDGFVRATDIVHSGTYSFYSDTGLDVMHTLELDSSLLVNTETRLHFWIYYDIMDDADVAFLEILPDGGEWQTLRTYRNSQTYWAEEELDLTPYNGQFVRLRFRYQTDDQMYKAGIYVDDFAIDNAAVVQWSALGENLSVTDRAITGRPGGTYYYRVAGITDVGQRNPWSNLIGVQVDVPALSLPWQLYY
jgi:immune inhibitor A